MRRVLLAVLCGFGVSVAGEMFTIVQGNVENLVTFTSDAPLEQVVGKTHMVTGYVSLPDGTSSGQAEIHLDLASLDTGLSLRNKHMRENHLETQIFPEAVFTLNTLFIPTGSLQPGERTAVKVSGALALHGVTREIAPETHLTLSNGGDELRIESSFSISLKDHQIKRPEFLVMKLADEQKIEVKLVARRSR
ncbi:YceI family protein [bacterium]|nr:YceI family protein [bacterium]